MSCTALTDYSLPTIQEDEPKGHISTMDGFLKLINLINSLQVSMAGLLNVFSDINSNQIDAENKNLQDWLALFPKADAQRYKDHPEWYSTDVSTASTNYNKASGDWQGFLQKLQTITDSLQTTVKELPTDGQNEIQGFQSIIEAMKVKNQLIQSGTGA